MPAAPARSSTVTRRKPYVAKARRPTSRSRWAICERSSGLNGRGTPASVLRRDQYRQTVTDWRGPSAPETPPRRAYLQADPGPHAAMTALRPHVGRRGAVRSAPPASGSDQSRGAVALLAFAVEASDADDPGCSSG